MKFDVKTGKAPHYICNGYVLLYQSEYNKDVGKSPLEIILREPEMVSSIRDENDNFKKIEYSINDFHLGVFPGKKEEFKSWLQETYTKIPDAAKYLFEQKDV